MLIRARNQITQIPSQMSDTKDQNELKDAEGVESGSLLGSSSISQKFRRVPCCLCSGTGKTTPQWVYDSPSSGDVREKCMQCNGDGFVFQGERP